MTDATDTAAELRAAAERVERLRSEVAERGLDREELETVADAYRSVEVVLDRWEDRATDWDDFEGYVKFRNDLAETLESIPEDVPERDAFLEADSCVKTGGVSKSLRTGDFDEAREALAPARRYAKLHSELNAAVAARREARKRAEKRRTELQGRIESLERLLELGEADLDAPIERLREPIAAYNDTVAEAFEAFRRETRAEAFLAFIQRATRTPFISYEAPPQRLLDYVQREDAGDYPLPELLEYADYSPSKLSHYVGDADLLKRRVATNRTYLEQLSSEPLRIGWPPEQAEPLRFRIDELIGLVGRFTGESAIETLREIQSLTRQDEYERLRRAAVADAKLTEAERKRLTSGDASAELSTIRGELEQLSTALSEHAD